MDFPIIKTIDNKITEAKENLEYSLYSEDLNGNSFDNEPNIVKHLLTLSRKNFSNFRMTDDRISCPEESRRISLDQKMKYFNYKCLELMAFSQKDRVIQLNFIVSN